jgi:glycine C-acetyltransferase
MGKVDIITTTLGKALGGASGGCVSARREIVEMCRQRGRPYLFSNTVPPVSVSAAIEVLSLLASTTERRDKLALNTAHWRRMLTEAGFDVRPGEHPIVPVMLYNARLASDMARELFDEGVYVVGFSFPVVPKGQARIRTQVSAAHAPADLERAFEAFRKVGARHGILGKKKKDLLDMFGP